MQSAVSSQSLLSASQRPSGVFPDQELHQQRRHQPSSSVQKSDMSSILSGESTRQFIKPSTRVHQAPGGTSSNIFGADPTPLAPQARNRSQNNIFGDAQEEIKHIPRRDPNRSSVAYESASNEDYRTTSKKQFQIPQEEVYHQPTPGRKMVSNSTGSSFSLQHDEFVPKQQPALTRRDPNARSEENYQRPSSRYSLSHAHLIKVC